MTPSKKPLWTLTAAAWSLAVLTLATSGSVPAAREAAADAVLHLPASVGSWSGGIIAKDRYDVGEPIKLECHVDAPVNATIARRWYGDGVTIKRIGDGTKVYAWGSAGDKSVTCLVAVYEPGETPQLAVRRYTAKFTIGPAPPPKPLNELVDAETAAKLANCLRVTVDGLKIAAPASPEDFLTTFADYVGSKGLTLNAAWPVILARVEQVAPAGKLFDRTAVSAVLTATADELSAPQPTPDPKPPGPDPTPVSPIQYPGFHVLVLEETSNRQGNPPPSAELRRYVEAKQGELRFIDKDQQPGLLGEFWQKAWALPRTQIPWVVIAKESQGFSGPWPADHAARLALLKQYGGE